MKLYDTNKIMVGWTGTVKFGEFKKRAKGTELIFIEDYYEKEINYRDMFSKTTYTIFEEAKNGELGIWGIKSLPMYVLKLCNDNSKLIKIALFKKILNGEEITQSELKKLKFALNSKNIYKMLMDEDINKDKKKNPNNKTIKLNYITTLSNKKYKLQPAIGRDIEIKEILTSLALNNKATLLIGERGVGKTSIVDEISYRISKKEIPEFFKNKKIIELNFSILNTDIDSMEENIIEIIERAKIDNLIIFIDGLENINNLSILKILKYEIEKNNLKVIATINSNNIIKIYNDDIFNKIIIDEPDDEKLKQIIKKIFTDYSSINNIKLLEEETIDSLILNLIKLTDTENRILSDCSNQPVNYDMYNPGLIIEIIDRIFADAIINNNSKLTIENILYGISSCNRIKEDIKNTTIKELKSSLHIYETYHAMKKLG